MSSLASRRSAVSWLAAAAMMLAGCATKDTASQAPQPKNGIAEYREIVGESRKSIAAALHALDRVAAHTNRCPPRICAAFAEEVQRLQVGSVRVRARSQAMQARGDAYFENWHENLARLKDPRVRALAGQHRPELQERFARIKLASQQAGNAFRPLLAGLRKLQGALESDPATVGTVSTKDLSRTTKENGRQVEQALAVIGEELKAMTVMLTPTKPATKG
jgi:hypothetical protein